MWPPETDTAEITPRELADILEEAGLKGGLAGKSDEECGLVLIDCREKDEFEICRLEGARHIPLSEFVFKAEGQIADKELPVVVYCHHGMRSSQAASFLRKRGYAKAFSLSGGIDSWAAEIDPKVPRY